MISEGRNLKNNGINFPSSFQTNIILRYNKILDGPLMVEFKTKGTTSSDQKLFLFPLQRRSQY